MRWLIFLSRVAFLSGIMLILAFTLLFYNWNKDEPVSSSIITAGYGLGIILIPLVNILYLFLTIWGKKIKNFIPAWLIGFNMLFFIILILYIFGINGYFNFKG